MPPIQLANKSATINAPIGDVWAIVSAFSAVKAWIPSIDSCTANGNSLGSVRSVGWGGNITEETLDVLDPLKHEISYIFTDSPALPLHKARGKITLAALGEKATQISWVAEAESFVSKAGDVEKAFVQTVLSRFIESSIEGLKASVEPATIHLF